METEIKMKQNESKTYIEYSSIFNVTDCFWKLLAVK